MWLPRELVDGRRKVLKPRLERHQLGLNRNQRRVVVLVLAEKVISPRQHNTNDEATDDTCDPIIPLGIQRLILATP
jgi:hypothetical protein